MMKLKHLTSKETQRPVAELEPTPAVRGPMTTDLNEDLRARGLTASEYCKKFALPGEWAAFQETVAARVVKEPTHVWETCDKCGFVFQRAYRSTAGRPCCKCNYAAYETGSFMRDMTPAEVTAYQDGTAKAETANRERDKRAALYARNEERKKAGLTPWTLAEFEAEERERARRLIGGSLSPAPPAKGRADVLESPRPAAELVQGPAAAPVAIVHRKGRAARVGKGA